MMEYFQILYIVIICGGTLYLIIKDVNPQGLLFCAGGALLLGTSLFNWGIGYIPVEKPTGSQFLDFFELMKEVFSSKLAGLGLIIMTVGGFSTYLSHIKASYKLVEYSIKPFSRVKEPYLLLSLFFILSVFLNMFITSATGLGLLLMVTVYPILRGLGISKYSSVGMIVTTGCLELGPVQGNVIVAAKESGLDIATYFVNYELIVAIPTVLVMAISHYFWQKRCDKKMGIDVATEKANYLKEESRELNDNSISKVPFYYAFFPIIPFIIVMLTSKLSLSIGIDLGVKLPIVTSLFFSIFIIVVIDFIRNRANLKKALGNFKYFLIGMEKMFPVVSLVVAGNIFATGLKSVGAIDMLISGAEHSGLGATSMIVVMVLIILVASALVGSGNATFIPLANIAPPVAKKFAIPAVNMLLPMQLVSSLARVLSPIVAVTIACAGIAEIKTIDVVARTYVPVLIAIGVMLTTSLILYS